MSVYLAKRPDGSLKSPYYQFDFKLKINGEHRRFYGSTKETSPKAAREFEKAEKKRARSARPNDHMTLNQVCDRYWEEVAQYQPSAGDTETACEHLCRILDGARLFINIGSSDLAEAVSKRSAEFVMVLKKVKGALQWVSTGKLVSAGTVNRQIVEMAQRLMRRAEDVWDMSVNASKIQWDELKRREPEERVREVSSEEADAFWGYLASERPDYVPFIWFLGNRGLRVRAQVGMGRKHVDLENMRIQVWRKSKKGGNKLVWVPVTAEQAAVLKAEMAKAPGQVWTYVYEGSVKEKRGMRFRITYSGLRRVIRNAMAAAGMEDFHIHDWRHDFGTKLLRRSQNLKLVQKAMGHRDIKSTLRYAHVLDEDVRDGLDLMPDMGGATGIRPEPRAKDGKNGA